MTNVINTDNIPVTTSEEWQPDPKNPRRRPPWIRVRAPMGETYQNVRD